jgi:hypothetical protein
MAGWLAGMDSSISPRPRREEASSSIRLSSETVQPVIAANLGNIKLASTLMLAKTLARNAIMNVCLIRIRQRGYGSCRKAIKCSSSTLIINALLYSEKNVTMHELENKDYWQISHNKPRLRCGHLL